ncbi:MAG: hypothetical protein L3J23_05010 [Flavobacteriaceae bacterium]|nr:hypothetical protein [Flavobacteriaceae bacterium]
MVTCKESEKKKEFLKDNYFNLRTPDTIHIYSDGKISKTPLTLLKNIRYVYVANFDKDIYAFYAPKIYKC